MTKVTLHYDLERPLTEADFPNLANLHSTYGMARVQITPTRLTVDYDASRLKKADVDAVLARHGVPIRVAADAVE